LRADTLTYDINALIDGRDLLIIQGNTLQWHHLDYAAVGRYGGQNLPTVVSSTDDGATVLNKYQWIPTWPLPPPDEIRFEAYSSVFSGLAPALPTTGRLGITVAPVDAGGSWCLSEPGRDTCGSVSIFQFPDTTNGNTAIVDFNDDPIGGAAFYTVQISVDTGGSVPEPGSGALIGLIGSVLIVAGLRRRLPKPPRKNE
jgi:hypothetical protein